jgi:hypothetical protein
MFPRRRTRTMSQFKMGQQMYLSGLLKEDEDAPPSVSYGALVVTPVGVELKVSTQGMSLHLGVPWETMRKQAARLKARKVTSDEPGDGDGNPAHDPDGVIPFTRVQDSADGGDIPDTRSRN